MSTILTTILAYLPAVWLTYALGGVVIAVLIYALYTTQEHASIAVIIFLMVWFPIESVILKYTPDTWYTLVKYTPELLAYTLAAVSLIRYAQKTGHIVPKNPLNKPLAAFVLVALVSLILNRYSVLTWAFGVRQTIRFVAVYYTIITQEFSFAIIKKIFGIGLVASIVEALIAIIQWAAHGSLDTYLFSTRTVAVGDMALVGGLEQFWTAGSRVFATMGRYDQLGSFLALSIIILFAYSYTISKADQIWKSRTIFAVLGLSLLLTSSRASWLAVVAGLGTIGIILMRDRVFVHRVVLGSVGLAVYLGLFAFTAGNVFAISDNPTQQSLPERLYEAVSLESWRGSYEGYGRIFFIINTPRMVVATAPLFGVGPGNYGGGTAAALQNTTTYDRLHLPFGIENIYGQIDNSWMSLWGEVGTLGLVTWIAILGSLIGVSRFVMRTSHDNEEIAAARALVGMVAGISVMAFFGPYFEFRTLMFYFWLLAGVVALLWRKYYYEGNFLQE